MAIKGKVFSESTFTPVSQGLHQAICTMIVDLGMQKGSDMYPDPKHKVYIGWDCLDEEAEWEKDGVKHSGPARIGREFSLAMGTKSNLRPFLEGWRGQNFTDEEAESFDITRLFGVPAQLTVVHKPKAKGGVRADVKAAVPWPKGLAKPAIPEGAACFDLSNPDKEAYEKLPKWLRKKVEERLADNESELHDGKGPVSLGSDLDDSDNIPF